MSKWLLYVLPQCPYALEYSQWEKNPYISYLHSKAIALNVFVLFRAKFCICVLSHFHACEKLLELGFVCSFFYVL